ncbi:hypothetical protein ACRALDRAFT_1028170 [Sodiomyces alcalophilus JCM 7366]|uniref:uncharacterized protein n=1 Tax=Sodiomyces alcalophilus JCM 7366 TaxID=591952 RepID=UPI0039B47EA2
MLSWSQPANQPCTTCHSLIQGNNVHDGLHIPLSHLRASAASKSACSSCVLLWQAVCTGVRPATPSPDIVFESIMVENRPPNYSDPLVIHIYPDPVAYGKTVQTLQLYITEEDAPTPWKLIGKGYHIAPHGLSDSCVSLAREWLDICVHAKGKHNNCTKVGVPELPTRAVFVGDHQTTPRLVVSEKGQRAQYAALSHCWGGSTPTMTTTDNFHQYTVSLPAKLPQTFLDALQVARALHLQYIWIDSLCIIQDWPEDWHREASRMAQVYTNAHVTISADAASDSTTGFLDVPAREAPPKFTLPYQHKETSGTFGASSSGVIHLRQRGFLAEELPFHSWATRDDSGRSRLSTRGWVFQERLLSPRTLHFSKNEMAWECRSVCECECSATSLRTLRTRSVIKHFLHPPPDDAEVNVSSVENSWRVDVVPAYTQLDLTVETDRLAAIEGLARAAERLRCGDRYVAGLWRNSLEVDLLWAVSPMGKRSHLIVGGGAPTWSWASVTGSITYLANHRTDMDPGLSVLDVSESENGTSPPVLSIKGHLVRVELGDEWSHAHSMAMPTPDIKLAIMWDVSDSRERVEDQADVETKAGALYYFLVFGSSANGNGPFGLLLYRVQKEQQDGSEERSEENVPFRRVGYIQGYRAARRIRRWGSGGWDSGSDDFVDGGNDAPTLTQGGTKHGERERERWLREVLQGEVTALKIA